MYCNYRTTRVNLSSICDHDILLNPILLSISQIYSQNICDSFKYVFFNASRLNCIYIYIQFDPYISRPKSIWHCRLFLESIHECQLGPCFSSDHHHLISPAPDHLTNQSHPSENSSHPIANHEIIMGSVTELHAGTLVLTVGDERGRWQWKGREERNYSPGFIKACLTSAAECVYGWRFLLDASDKE